MRQCPRCASEISERDKVCPRCGLPVDKMNFGEELADKLESEAKSSSLNRAQKSEKRRLARKARKEAKRQKKLEESISTTNFSKYAVNSNETEDFPKLKVKKSDKMQFKLDENGEIDIDTSDVEIIGEETSKLLEERIQKTYSVKKARGDYKQPKIKWWEIYKLADRAFARRKIKKEVNKAAKVRPDFISKTKLLLLAIFFGWCGAHNFYAKNKKRGFFTLICFFASTIALFISDSIKNAAVRVTIQNWVVGCFGFIVLLIWIGDVVNIIFGQFKYRIQIDKFISEMNIQTRAKLGEKYIDLDLLHKPWPVRFKVWCQKKKRDYQEWKHDRRQMMIDKEKEKLAKQEQQDAIEREIANFEEKEDKQLKEKKKKELDEVKEENQVDKKPIVHQKKQARVTVSKKNSKTKSKKKK